MTKQLFAERVARELNGTVKTTEKANGVVLTGVAVGDGELKTLYYIDDYYEGGNNINETVEYIKDDMSKRNVPNLEDINDITYLKILKIKFA